MAIDIQKTNDEMVAALKSARDIGDKAEQEKRDITDEERKSAQDFLKTAREKKDLLLKAKADREIKDAIDALEGIDLGGFDENKGYSRQRPQKTLGEAFTDAKEWTEWISKMAPGGRFPDSKKGIQSPVLQIADFGLFPQKRRYGDHERKELLTGASAISAGAFVESDRTGIYEALGRHPLSVRQLIDVRTTSSDTVEFVRQTVQVTQAAPVPEANVTDFTGATGEISGEKPEATTRFERITETVKTIAVWIPATKRALSDAAQLRGLIDSELRDDLAEETEDQILNGDDVTNSEDLPGLNNTANVLVQAFNTDIAITARKAITNLEVNGKQMPTAWLLNPIDVEAFDLLQDNEGRFYWGGPLAMMPQRPIWSVPSAKGFFQAQGTGWLANWRKAVLWDREQGSISVSDSHADFFIRNMIAILAELRCAFGVIRPSAFCQVDLQSGS